MLRILILPEARQLGNDAHTRQSFPGSTDSGVSHTNLGCLSLGHCEGEMTSWMVKFRGGFIGVDLEFTGSWRGVKGKSCAANERAFSSGGGGWLCGLIS